MSSGRRALLIGAAGVSACAVGKCLGGHWWLNARRGQGRGGQAARAPASRAGRWQADTDIHLAGQDAGDQFLGDVVRAVPWKCRICVEARRTLAAKACNLSASPSIVAEPSGASSRKSASTTRCLLA